MTLEAVILTHKMFPGSRFTREKYIDSYGRAREFYWLDRDGDVEVSYDTSRFYPGERSHATFFGSYESRHADDWVLFTSGGERI